MTRRPLILQLHHLKADAKKENAYEEWGEFLHQPNKIYYNFQDIKKEIEAETERTTGKNKGVSTVPINLKVYSPNVLNLTLVDLPGMTKVPVGDQPKDIERQIREMIYTFIEKPNAIILAVTPANTDVATSDALQMAREVDPAGLRTVGVITKIDLMDKGTDCMDILLGKTYPLKLGFIGVINRSQQDIQKNKDIKDAQAGEKDFFANNALYRSISNRLGTPFLSKQLNKILVNHIRDAIPELKMKVGKMMNETQAEMAQYGDNFGGQNGAVLLNVITKFCQDYRAIIDGTSTSHRDGDDMFGGARVNYIFNDIYKRHIMDIDPIEGLSAETIRLAIRNATGTRSALFIPEQAFEILVKKQITRLRDPSLQCIGLVYDELQRIVSQVESPELARFGVLRERLVECVNDLLRKCREPTQKLSNDLINIELSYINTAHPDFIGGGGALGKFFDRLARTRQTEEYQQGELQQQQISMQQQSQQHQQQPQQNNILPEMNVKQGSLMETAQKFQQGGDNQQQAPQRRAPNAQGGNQAQQQGGPGQGSFFSAFFGNQPGGQPGAPGGQKQMTTSNPYASGGQKRQEPNPFAKQPAQTQSSTQSSQSSTQSVTMQRQQEEERRRQKQTEDEERAKIEYERQKLARPENMLRTTNASDKDVFEAELIKDLMESYFTIVRRNVLDTVPKSIMFYLVNDSKNRMQNELVASLYKEELFSELLEEGPQVANQRQRCSKLLDVLKKAHRILNEVRDFSLEKMDGGGSSNTMGSLGGDSYSASDSMFKY